MLARTLVRNIDYIILDETTSEIDIKSERKILERIFTEYKKTIILISHRDSNEDLFTKKVFVWKGDLWKRLVQNKQKKFMVVD